MTAGLTLDILRTWYGLVIITNERPKKATRQMITGLIFIILSMSSVCTGIII